jgi:hypothetical protein
LPRQFYKIKKVNIILTFFSFEVLGSGSMTFLKASSDVDIFKLIIIWSWNP